MNSQRVRAVFLNFVITTVVAVFLASLCAPTVQAQTKVIVRDALGLPGARLACKVAGCRVGKSLGDPDGNVFVVVFPDTGNLAAGLLALTSQAGVISAEADAPVGLQQAYSGNAPDYLTDTTPVAYYGSTVWRGYVIQPGNQIIRTSQTQASFKGTGVGTIVAVIDTGADPNHPVLAPVTFSPYDCTRDNTGADETADVNVIPDSGNPQGTFNVNQRTVAVLDQRTVAVLDGGPYSAFGHGTMTAGIVHLVAPSAKIMPIKAFSADGTGYKSDILQALNYAIQHGADVINMSFDTPTYSKELANAIQRAQKRGIVLVASAGNTGQRTVVYPSGFPGVINVASTSDEDIQSTFTNYGAPPVYMAAPGEGIMTTYPWGTYAAGWGTSFSTPFVAGTAALMLGTNGGCSSNLAVASGLASAEYVGNVDLGFGRLDTFQAVSSCRPTLRTNMAAPARK